ncbi:MAG: multicopper oxidase domain-containing protein [Gemmatimonadetes bacterium]|nr:multicopper oxidase domain-containing protein [Gemmatimonadota bacterium]
MSKRRGNRASMATGEQMTRREALKIGAFGAAGLAAAGGSLAMTPGGKPAPGGMHGGHELAMPVAHPRRDSFDPTSFLTHFDTGRVSMLPSGQTLREYDIVATDAEIEVAPGVFFPAWTYNGSVPGPTIRCTEGDRVRVRFANAGSHPHTMHFHGIHAADMDGVFEIVNPGGSYVYEFDAEPYGLHLYHCHATPLKRHIHKGLYGTFLIDPPGGRPPANEMVLVMNGFDTNFDGENEIYAVNTVGFHYQTNPIRIRKNELNRIYLVNATEFDQINSFHLHGNFFQLYRTGTTLAPTEYTDTVMLCQGERAILEFRYKHIGRFMFHAHQSEFAELGWTGFFQVDEALHA